MPKQGYANLTVLKEIRDELEKLREELKLTSLNDVLAVLIKTYRERTSIASKLEKLHTNIVSMLDEIRTSIASPGTSNTSPSQVPSTSTTSTSQKTAPSESTSITSTGTSVTSTRHVPSTSVASPRTSSASTRDSRFLEIVRKRRFQFLSEMKLRNPDAFLAKARRLGVKVVEGARDVAVVDPGFYEEFREKLGKISSSSDEDVREVLGGDYGFFRFLVENGLIYFDAVERRWKWV